MKHLHECMQRIAEQFNNLDHQESFWALMNVLLGSTDKTLSANGIKSTSGLSRFLSTYEWQVNLNLREELLRQAPALAQCHRALLRQGTRLRLLLDTSVLVKTGTHFELLGEYYSTTERKVVPGHTVLVLAVRVFGQTFPVGFRFYFSKEALLQYRLLLEAKGQPTDDVPVYRSLEDLGDELLQEFFTETLPQLKATCRCKFKKILIVADGDFTTNRVVNLCRAYKAHYTGLIARDQYLVLESLKDLQHLKRKRKCPSRPTLAQVSPAEQKRLCQVRDLRRGLIGRVLAIGLRMRIVRQYAKNEVRYIATTLLSLADSQVRYDYARRHWIETLFRTLKQNFGLEDYRVRRWRAIERYIRFVFLAYLLVALAQAYQGTVIWRQAQWQVLEEMLMLTATLSVIERFVRHGLEQCHTLVEFLKESRYSGIIQL